MATTDTQSVSAGIVGELLLEEIPEWHVGVCRITVKDDRIYVLGDNDKPAGVVELDVYRQSVLDPSDVVLDLEVLAERVTRLVQAEHDAL